MAVTPAFLNSKLAQLIAVMMTSLLNGVFAVLSGFVAWVLIMNHRCMSIMRKTLFGASIFMFLISATHLGLVMQELALDASPISNRQAQVILAAIMYITGDLIIIWRVWVVWSHNYLVIAGPLVILIVGAGFSLYLLYTTHVLYPVVPVSLIVANTSLCTLLIAGRIWYMHRKVFHSRNSSSVNSHYKGILFLIIESGALYAGTMIATLILNFHASVALPIVLDLEIPLIGILPTLIIVFVHLDLGSRFNPEQRTHSILFRRFSHDIDGGHLTSPDDGTELKGPIIAPPRTHATSRSCSRSSPNLHFGPDMRWPAAGIRC